MKESAPSSTKYLKASDNMKITLELDNQIFEQEGELDEFELLLNILADGAGIKTYEEQIKLLDKEQLRAIDSI